MNLKDQRAAAAWFLLTACRCSCFREFSSTGDYDGFGPDDVDTDVSLTPFGSQEPDGAGATDYLPDLDSIKGKEPEEIFVDLSGPQTQHLSKQGFLQKSNVAKSRRNDTVINLEYWRRVDEALANAGLTTAEPEVLSMDPDVPTLEPYHKIYIAKHQPIDTRIGAKLLYEMEDRHDDVRALTPPNQKTALTQFVSPCPMVLFMKDLDIYGSDTHCSEDDNQGQGRWEEPQEKRTLLRWRRWDSTGVFYGVDSALTGPGSVMFGEMKYKWVLRGVKFEFVNCLQVGRWHIDEEITKVSNVGANIDSTFQAHDTHNIGLGFYLKYVIRYSNGTIVAETNLFRMFSNTVNFTAVRPIGSITPGSLIATAQRRGGSWKGKEWRCKNHYFWHMEFPQPERLFDTLATAQDLRVATSAIITLMARRDEDRSESNALLDSVQTDVIWYIFMGLLVLTQICCVAYFLKYLWDWSLTREKLRKFFFKFEEASLPKYGMQQHRAPVHAAW